VHRSRCIGRVQLLFMQKALWTFMRATMPVDVSRVIWNLPTDFGFPIDLHAHERETIYVVPITSDSDSLPPRNAPSVP